MWLSLWAARPAHQWRIRGVAFLCVDSENG